MRTTKRFTSTVLVRFRRQGRGEGTYADFLPWHGVSRGDPASCGRSHLLNYIGRLRELLSDGELGAQLFATMLPDLDDSLEQYPLPLDDSAHPLAAYGERGPDELYPGTKRIAMEMGIRHPSLSEAGRTELWRATTDLVLVLKTPGHPRQMLAVAFKPKDWKPTRRARQLLSLEREFWIRRGVPWLFITPELYHKEVEMTLRRSACWALGDTVPGEQIEHAGDVARSLPGRSLTDVIDTIACTLGDKELAQRALWQAIWSGALPVDLRRGWRPHVPLKVIPAEQFVALNPIASRRTAWS